MKKTTTILIVLWSMLLSAVASETSIPRDTISLNRSWLFSREVKDGQLVHGDSVDLPHDFLITQPWVTPAKDEQADNRDAAANVASILSARGFKAMGCGWYERKLNVDSLALRDKRVLLDFQGIMLVGDVWLNGEHLGKTDYGYVGFEIDITKKLKRNGENMIRVKADTGHPQNSRWYTGGGLFRDVNLIITPAKSYFTRHPLYITTRDNREVCIKAEVYHDDKEAKCLDFGVRILDATGKVVAEQHSFPAYYRSWKQAEYQLSPIAIPQPRLWNLDTPYLYTAEVTLYDKDGTVLDQVTERFGIRTIEMTPQQGLLLNGKKVLLKGLANHHTLGALGAAAYPRAIEKRLRMLKDFGFNHIRTSHNPYSEDLYRYCDEIGILVVDELYDKWTTQYAGGREDWQSLWQKDIPEWVRRDRNHPSIVMWSLGNELQQMPHLPFNDWGVTAYKLQRELLMRYDSTRLTTVAMHPRYRDLATDSLPAPLARATDVAAYNYRYMYFPGDAKRFPNMMFYQSEASVKDMPDNFFGMDLDKVIGLAYWGVIDYLGESKGWPKKGWTEGVFDISLQPKPQAYLVRSMFKPQEPVVHIAIEESENNDAEWNGVKINTPTMCDHWNHQSGKLLKMFVYSNADEVELVVNGKSLGRKATRRCRALWEQVAWQAGYAEALAYHQGKLVARHRIETTGPAVALRLEPDNAHWRADGIDLQHVRITAIDRKGRVVPTANDDVTIQVTDGDARLVAVSNGDLTSDETAGQQHIHLYQGSALAILRAGTRPGRVRLKATSPRLQSCTHLTSTGCDFMQ